MKYKFWLLLLLASFSFPSLAQEISPIDSIVSTVETTTVNDYAQQADDEIAGLSAYWQLSEYLIYEDYPDSIKAKLDLRKGYEFLSLNANGEYEARINGVFSKGYWLKNNNLLLFKQKDPKTIDIYNEILEDSDSELKVEK